MRTSRFIVLTVVVAVVLSACITQADSYTAQNPRSVSEVPTATPTPVPALSTPTTLSAQQTSAGTERGSVTISWSAVTGATAYQLQMKTGDTSWQSASAGQNLTETSVSLGLSNGVPYSFRVRAVNTSSGAESPFSAVLSVTLAAATPTPTATPTPAP